MKGKVLGFDAAAGTGAISGDDGQRYNFTAADFKSPPPAKPNDAVDFEAEGGSARNIYITAASVDLAAVASNPTVAKILAKPYVLWAAVVILGSLIAGHLSYLNLLSLGFSGLVMALHALIPIAAGVLIYFEFTNNAMTQNMRFATAGLAIGGPILLPLIAGFGFYVSFGMLVTIAGGVLIVLTHMGIIKKLV